MTPEIVRGQIEAALSDIGADVIKIGMLGNGAIATAVAEALETVTLPIVLDPVLVATSGDFLLDDEGLSVIKNRLIPRAALVTPNLPETRALTGILPQTGDDVRAAAEIFARMGAAHVLLKGGHGKDEIVRDILISGAQQFVFEAARQHTAHTHGTGCTMASAIACGLALGLPLRDAVGRAHAYVQRAIAAAPGLGGGHGPLGHHV